jgi:cytochrome c biogenesis protein CcmG/thiol:disulfide interchange protein DsbE
MNLRLLPLAGFALLIALLGFGIAWNQRHEMNEVPSPLIGKLVPEFTLPLLYDSTKTLDRAQLLGQPYLLNVFASWCVSCREEHPVLMAQAAQLGVRVIGFDYKDDPDDAKRWLAQFGNPYAMIVADQAGTVAIDFGVYGAPETFLIDAKGVIRYKRIGALTPDVIARELKPKIDALGREGS